MAFLCHTALMLALLPQAAGPAPQAPAAQGSEPKATVSSTARTDDLAPEERLMRVKRIFVESFGDDPISKQIHAMVITGLTEAKRFIVTENKDRADAVLKGTGLEKTSQELHAYDDSTTVAGAAGGHSGSVGGSWHNGTGSVSGSSSGGFVSRAAGISDSSVNTETINDARVAVRLVDRDGDVIWTTSQESKGAKYKGASADVADKVVKQLMRDLSKVEKKKTEPADGPKAN